MNKLDKLKAELSELEEQERDYRQRKTSREKLREEAIETCAQWLNSLFPISLEMARIEAQEWIENVFPNLEKGNLINWFSQKIK